MEYNVWGPSLQGFLEAIPLMWLAVLLAAIGCFLFAGGIITGIALCVWASKTRIHEPLQ